MIVVNTFIHIRYVTHPSSDISTCDHSNEVTQCVHKPWNFSVPVWEFRRCKPKASSLVSTLFYWQVTGKGRALDRRLQFRGVLNFQMPFELLNISSEELIGNGAARRSCLLCITWPVHSGDSIVLHHNHCLEQIVAFNCCHKYAVRSRCEVSWGYNGQSWGLSSLWAIKMTLRILRMTQKL